MFRTMLIAVAVMTSCSTLVLAASPALPEVEAVVREFVALDEAHNDGKGESESSNSATLGWGESGWLRSYWHMYELTGDTRWWDKIIAHVDRMLLNLSDHDGDGFMSWQTSRYSTALIRAERLHNRGTAKIAVREPKIMNGKKAAKVTGHRYVIEFHDANTFTVRDATTSRVLVPKAAYADGKPITVAENVSVVITDNPRQGDCFCVWTTAPKAIEYVVHQGMVLTPVARFIEQALKRPVNDPYHVKAKAFCKVIRKHFLLGNEKTWIDTKDGAGAHRFGTEPTQRYPNRILPHNQYLALARAWLILADATGDELYRKRAVAMAKHFKQALRLRGDTYEWYYWDWIENGEPGHSFIEDSSHGHIDVGFVVDAIRRGVVFADEDGKRLARTMLEKMWNGSTEEPAFGRHIHRADNPGLYVIDWAELCQWDPRVADLLATAIMARKPGKTRTQYMAALLVAKKHAAARR